MWSVSLFAKLRRKLKGVACFRTVLRDPSLSDGAFRTLMLMKAKSKQGFLTTLQETLAKERSVTIRTIGRHIAEIEAKRLIRIVHNVSRGQWVESTYAIDDEFYAKHLAKKPRRPSDKNVRAVPYGTIHIPAVRETVKVVEFPRQPVTYPKPKRKAKA